MCIDGLLQFGLHSKNKQRCFSRVLSFIDSYQIITFGKLIEKIFDMRFFDKCERSFETD